MTLTVVLRVAPGGPALAINPPPPVPPATSSGSMMAPTTPGSTAQAPAPTSRGIISPIPAARRRPQRAHAKTAGAPLHVPLHARPRLSAQTAAQRVLCAASELPSPPPRLTIDAGSDAGAGALPGRHRRRLRGDVVTRTVAGPSGSGADFALATVGCISVSMQVNAPGRKPGGCLHLQRRNAAAFLANLYTSSSPSTSRETGVRV